MLFRSWPLIADIHIHGYLGLHIIGIIDSGEYLHLPIVNILLDFNHRLKRLCSCKPNRHLLPQAHLQLLGLIRRQVIDTLSQAVHSHRELRARSHVVYDAQPVPEELAAGVLQVVFEDAQNWGAQGVRQHAV